VQPNLAQRASKDVLKDLIHLSLYVMLDDRLEKEEQGEQVVRALNVLVLKMVEKTEHTAMMRYKIKAIFEERIELIFKYFIQCSLPAIARCGWK